MNSFCILPTAFFHRFIDLVVKFECLVVKMGHIVVIFEDLIVKIMDLVVIVK